MSRLRSLRDETAAVVQVADANPAKTRGDALSDAAYLAKRSADTLIEQEQGRSRMLAGFAGAGGLLALLLGLAAMGGIGQPQLLALLAAVAILVPTAYAFAQTVGPASRVADASYERGFCQALASNAKRLGDSIGATDQRNIPLGPEAIINLQLDTLYKDLDRSRQRLQAAGADPGQRTAANRLHERIVPNYVDTFLTGSDGRRYPVRIVDVSQSGVALKGSMPPLYDGEQVQVGSRRAKVVKLAPGEAALQFLSPILPSEFNRKMVL